MHVTRRNKFFAAIAGVALLAAGGSWAVLGDDGTSPPETSSPSTQAPVENRATDPSSAPEKTGTKGSKGEKSDGRSPRKAGAKAGAKDKGTSQQHTGHDSGEKSQDESGDASTDGSSDESSDTSGDESDDETTVTLGTGDTVQVQAVQTEAPVPLDSVGDFGTGLTVRLSDVTSAQAEAKAPGEIAGPAVQVVVEAVNDGGSEVSLDGVVVFLSYGT